MIEQKLNTDHTIEQILALWPQTIPVFIRFHMLCIGCPITPFHDLSDACRAHGISLEPVETALHEAINSDPQQSPSKHEGAKL